jgi:nucleotide-binding universal stress UspA family protein
MYEKILVAVDHSDISARVLEAAGSLAALSRGEAHGVVRDTALGHAAREIVSDAAEHGVDVIVRGSRGRGDLAGLVLGSTAHKGHPPGGPAGSRGAVTAPRQPGARKRPPAHRQPEAARWRRR